MSWCSLNRHIHVSILPKVCSLGLHISLGIFQGPFELLEAECHKLDLVCAENCQQLPILDNPWVTDWEYNKQKSPPCIVMIQSVHTCNTDVLTQDSRTTELEDVCNKGFETNEGHFVHSLDMALASMNVHRRAYRGWTFIGNHLHKCLTVGNYNHTLMLLIRILLIFRQN